MTPPWHKLHQNSFFLPVVVTLKSLIDPHSVILNLLNCDSPLANSPLSHTDPLQVLAQLLDSHPDVCVLCAVSWKSIYTPSSCKVWCESVFSPINLTTFCISYLLPWSALFFSPLCCTFIVMKKKPDLTKLTKFIWFIGTCSENPHVRVDNMCISLMCIWKMQTHTLRSCCNYKQRKHKQMMFQICNRLQSAQSLKHTDSCWATLTDSDWFWFTCNEADVLAVWWSGAFSCVLTQYQQ